MSRTSFLIIALSTAIGCQPASVAIPSSTLNASLSFERLGTAVTCSDVPTGLIYAAVEESDGSFVEEVDLPCSDELTFLLASPASDVSVRLSSEPYAADDQADLALPEMFDHYYVSDWVPLGRIGEGEVYDEDFTLDCLTTTDLQGCDS